MNTVKLNEALQLVNEMTADVEGRYPFGLIRVRRLLEETLAEVNDQVEAWEDEVIELAEEPPPAA